MPKFLIEHQCSQCGAPMTLEESDRMVKCGYCRVESYLIQYPYFRYMLHHNAPENSQLFYVPYWRFKGMLFSTLSHGLEHRFMDVSYQGIQSNHFPVSLGFRSQALKLKFATSETQGSFIQTTFPLDEAMKIFTRRFNKNIQHPIFHQDFIGESLNIIYSPFYLKKQVIDAVINREVSDHIPDDFSLESLPEDPRKWRLLFIPTLCPHCGWNLKGERDSIALFCRNCHSVWFAKGEKLKRVKFGTLKMPGDVFLPFWRIKASVEGIDLHSYADLIKHANLPRLPKPDDHNSDFFFWSMAFKVPPKIFLRLNRNVTLSQPSHEQIGQLPPGIVYPVTLSATQAANSMKINFASFACPLEHYLPNLSEIKIHPEKARLVFIPFHEGHHELIQEKFGLTISKNQLRLSSNL